jgi:hypothetical protein
MLAGKTGLLTVTLGHVFDLEQAVELERYMRRITCILSITCFLSIDSTKATV